jgi:putative RecB family exonuclease
VIYSYSKLRSFENCPLQFRLRYLDRIPAPAEGIEAFTGKRVHEVLEALYRALLPDPEPPPLEELLELFDVAWDRAWHSAVEIVRPEATVEDYRQMGRRCLATFYRGNWPFAGDRTLGLEVDLEFALDPGTLPGTRLRGVADRVAVNELGELVIHDYKTSTYLPRKEAILADLQLAIYQLGAAELWPDRRDPKLVWHFLAFGRRITVRLGGDGLAWKAKDILRGVGRIEQAIASDRFPARISKLCRWCSYRAYCPEYAERQGVPPIALPAPPPEPPPTQERDGGADRFGLDHERPLPGSRLELRALTQGRGRVRSPAELEALLARERQLKLI